MACKLCRERGKTWNGDDPKCAFEHGTFLDDNWMCATMNALRQHPNISVTFSDDSRCGVLPFDYGRNTERDYGFLVMAWYKQRCVPSAVIVRDDPPPNDRWELTEQIALAILGEEVQ